MTVARLGVARVLVIEDEANNLDVAQRIIRAAGHEALIAMDGQSGLDIARAQRPDAILVDLLLPRVDGWTVTRLLREEAWAARIPIIAVSALAMQQDRQRAIDAGCDDFVSKPYAPAELRGSSGEQALAIADRERPDLILLDVMMPGIDGWETCRRLKANERTSAIPVIFVTAKDQTDDVVTGFEAGGVDYVAKPFEPVELAARVRSALFTKRLQDQLRASNEELKKVERSRQELIGMLGHDIRNLANSVVAFLQLVGMGQLDPSRPEFAELLGLSESNVSEMLRMVNALLDVYKLEEGRLEAVPQAIRLEELARKSISQVKPEARAKNITVTSEVGDATVFVDDGLVVRVLTNLLANAVKHTPTGGKVHIDARKADEGTDFVLVRVSDTGPGITTADAPNVFDRFYQGGGGRSRGGTGLGLAFCRLAVALHGGTIRVANPGQPGAMIDLTLPAAAADHASVPA